MKTRVTFLAGVFLALTISTPETEAFEVKNSSAYQVTADTYLFTIEYEYGFLNAEGQLPVWGSNTTPVETMKPNIHYRIVDDSGAQITTGQQVALVLSGAAIKDGHYSIPEGERESFTLLVLYRALRDSDTSGTASQPSAK